MNLESSYLALVLAMEEGVVLVLDKNVALVLVLVLVLEETVACAKEPWGSGHTGPCPEYLHVQSPVCLLLQVVLALEEDVVCTMGHPARRQGPGGGKRQLKDTNRGACQRGARQQG